MIGFYIVIILKQIVKILLLYYQRFFFYFRTIFLQEKQNYKNDKTLTATNVIISDQFFKSRLKYYYIQSMWEKILFY